MNIYDRRADLPRRGSYQRRAVRDIRWVVVHHTATAANVTPEAIAQMHLARGWAGCGYHYLVYDGYAIKARALSDVPACVRGANRESICVAVVGDYRQYPPTMDRLRTAMVLCDALIGMSPCLVVVTHRALSSTVCPGNALVAAWQDLARRERRVGILDGGGRTA